MKKIKKVSVIMFLFLFILQTFCFASSDQVKLFLSTDFTDDSYAREATSYAVLTFQDLGYNNVTGTNKYTITNSRDIVLDYISQSGNNYAFFEFAHGVDGRFNMSRDGSNAPQRIYSSDITGNWHLVFLNSCEIMASDSMASAFKTVGYSNRATLGWYKTVYTDGCVEWWSHFYPIAGSTNLRSACLAAADQCEKDTPIRIYGDKTWDGKAW